MMPPADDVFRDAEVMNEHSVLQVLHLTPPFYIKIIDFIKKAFRGSSIEGIQTGEGSAQAPRFDVNRFASGGTVETVGKPKVRLP